MSLAILGTIAGVVDAVAKIAPLLINSVSGLADLYSQASDAITDAAPDGTVAAADWSALTATIAALQASLDKEIAADAAAAAAV